MQKADCENVKCEKTIAIARSRSLELSDLSSKFKITLIIFYFWVFLNWPKTSLKLEDHYFLQLQSFFMHL